MKRRDLEKSLKEMGWHLLRNGRRHSIWSDGENELAVPRHNEINELTAKGILADAMQSMRTKLEALGKKRSNRSGSIAMVVLKQEGRKK